MRPAATVVLGTLAASGCFSSKYAGSDPRKVYVTMKDGARGYSKAGELHTERGLGGALVDVVADNPEAARAARTFRRRTRDGLLMMLTGMLCLPAVVTYDVLSASEDDTGLPAGHGYLLLGCGVLAVVGGTYMLSGLPYQLDAINIYNDAIDARRVPWPPPPAPRLPAIAPAPTPAPDPAPAPAPDPQPVQGAPGSVDE